MTTLSLALVLFSAFFFITTCASKDLNAEGEIIRLVREPGKKKGSDNADGNKKKGSDKADGNKKKGSDKPDGKKKKSEKKRRRTRNRGNKKESQFDKVKPNGSKKEDLKKKKTSRKNGNDNIKKDLRSNVKAINATCIANILSIANTYFVPMMNYDAQRKRIIRQNKTADSKGGKKGAFNKALQRLVEAGGGNASDLSCQGSTDSTGALQLANLTTTLSNCSNEIYDACSLDKRPKPNMTAVNRCNDLMSMYKDSFVACKAMASDGAAACDCFANSTFTEVSEEFKTCTLKDIASEMVSSNKVCKKAYGKCRKYQEAIVGAVSACSKSTNQLKEKAKTLSENSDNMEKAQASVAALTASRLVHNKLHRSQRSAPTTCQGMIILATLVVEIIKQNAASPKVSETCILIVAATGITCSDDEKASLKKTEESMAEAKEALDEAKEAVFEDLQSQTGSTPSSSELESFTVAVTTAAPKTRRNVRDLVKGFLH